MKKVVIIVLAITICLASIPRQTYAEGGIYNWYIIKRGNDTPGFPKESELIESLGGVYMDRSAADSNRRVIYLTFDAGYDNGNVTKVVNILKAKNVNASFFILSNLIRKNPELIRSMASDGNLVCNHTDNHKDMTTLSNSEFLDNLKRLEDLYFDCTGLEMSKFFRFPEGRYDTEKLRCASEAGYTTVFWSLAYADWDNARQPSDSSAMKILEDNCHSGAILLLHPTSATNVRILPLLIDKWLAEGYEFRTLDQMV